MKRRFDPAVLELMDQPQSVSAELKSDLRNLRQLNHYFGSYNLVRWFLKRWIKPGDNLRVLDLATGSGDIPRLIVDYARKVGASVKVDALDRQTATLDVARALSGGYPEISFVMADVFAWEPQTPYDIVLCSLALHHFSEKDAVRVLRCMREWSRRFVLVADLCRGLFGVVGVYLLTAVIFRNPMTRHDGRLSIARSFSFGEMAELARKAGWANFGHKKFRFSRQAIWREPA